VRVVQQTITLMRDPLILQAEPAPVAPAPPVVREIVREVPRVPRGTQWLGMLAELAAQLDTGRVYERDLPAVAAGLEVVLDALARRAGHR
jgi:hypothetical protein